MTSLILSGLFGILMGVYMTHYVVEYKLGMIIRVQFVFIAAMIFGVLA